MKTHLRSLLLILPLVAAACGVGADADPTGSRDDRLVGGPPSQGCGALNESACLAASARCEPVYSGGICPLSACPVGVSCPPCPPARFVECRAHCELLNETECNSRSDCTASYDTQICPLSACMDPTQCPPCPKGFISCSAGGRTGGGTVGGSVGSTSPGSPP